MDADQANQIERDRDDIFDRWLASSGGEPTFRTWLEARPALLEKWEACS